MKTTIKLTKLFVVTLMLTVFACSKDDNPDGGNAGINAQNLIATVDENPTNGQIVGTVQATGNGTLSFSITSQTPSGAMSINPSTGELTVANTSLFDFETNPIINVSVSIIDAANSATATVAINLNDLDDIESFLSTSKADYISASAGDWIEVTETEYNMLATSLNQVSKVVMDDTDYNTGPTGETFVDATVANNDGITMPSNSYVFAVKYNFFGDGSGATIKIKQSSTSISSGYSDLGNTLDNASVGNHYFVLKGNDAATTGTGFLAIYDSSGQLGFAEISDNNIQFEFSDANDLISNQPSSTVFYQGLSTTQKQW